MTSDVYPFDDTSIAASRKIASVNQVNHSSWVTVVNSIHLPVHFRTRRVIELAGEFPIDVWIWNIKRDFY